MIRMLDSWLKSSTSCSWNDVITALRVINETTLADGLELQLSTTDEQHSKSSGML